MVEKIIRKTIYVGLGLCTNVAFTHHVCIVSSLSQVIGMFELPSFQVTDGQPTRQRWW